MSSTDTTLLSPEAKETPDGQGVEQETVLGSEPKAAEPQPDAQVSDQSPDQTDQVDDPKPEPKAPEAYEFQVPENLPEDHSVDEEMLSQWGEIARELDLSQESAQLVVDKFLPAMFERAEAQQRATVDQWAADARKHPDVTAGEGLEANLRAAEGAIQKFGSDGLRGLLRQGLGSHPEVVAFIVKVGNALQPDGFVSGGPARDSLPGINDIAGMAERLYGGTPRS